MSLPAGCAAALLVGAASLAAMPAAAQVFKCGKAGATVFSDRPCGDAGDAPLRLPAGGANGSLDFDMITRHYQVRGASLQAARASMRQNGPEGWSGYARWDARYNYQTKATGSNCAISAATVRVRGDIQMPEWADLRSASPSDQAAWHAMYSTLKRHEDGHIQHGREFGILLKERLLGLGTVPCAELADRAQKEMSQLQANLARRDKEYDARTDHGLRQDNPR